jgi:hypothetical protein
MIVKTLGSMDKQPVARTGKQNTRSEKTYGGENTSAIMTKLPVAIKIPAVKKTCHSENTSASWINFR